MKKKEINRADLLPKLTYCPICGKGRIIKGKGIVLHIHRKHPEYRYLKKFLWDGGEKNV